MTPPQRAVNTKDDAVRIRTHRGVITIGPGDKIEGLWRVVQRELRTNAQARKMCGNPTRATLIRWRTRPHDPFPPPVAHFPANSGDMELWSRTEVEEWYVRYQENLPSD